MWKEFKEFIARGNVLDLAIGVVMGSAVTAIVNALVDAIIMPIINAVTGNASVEEWVIPIGSASLGVGQLIQAIINFLIIAIILFFILKAVNRLVPKVEEETEDEEIETTDDYLRDIRDLLQSQKVETK